MHRFTRHVLFAMALVSPATFAGALPTLTPTPFDYGNVTVGGISAAQVFTLDNATADTMTIISAGLGGFAPQHYTLGVNTCAGVILPGGSCSLSVTFTPDAPGNQVALVRVSYTIPSVAGQPELDATISGTGVAAPAAPTQPVPALGYISLAIGMILMLVGARLSGIRRPLD